MIYLPSSAIIKDTIKFFKTRQKKALYDVEEVDNKDVLAMKTTWPNTKEFTVEQIKLTNYTTSTIGEIK